MATHSSVLAWRVPWIEEPGGLQSMGSQRLRQDLVTGHAHIPKWIITYFVTIKVVLFFFSKL